MLRTNFNIPIKNIIAGTD